MVRLGRSEIITSSDYFDSRKLFLNHIPHILNVLVDPDAACVIGVSCRLLQLSEEVGRFCRKAASALPVVALYSAAQIELTLCANSPYLQAERPQPRFCR